MSKALGFMAILFVLVAALFWVPENITYRITFVDVQTDKPITNTRLVIGYDPVCQSSPCHRPETIFDGQTDEKGQIRLKGHTTQDLNRFFGSAWLPGFEYSIKTDQHTRLWPEEGRENPSVVYLLKKQDVMHDLFTHSAIYFNWSEIIIVPEFDLKIGPVIESELSPNKAHLYVATGQGGGIASFIYEIGTKTAHFLGNEIRNEGHWMHDGRLEVVNRQQFGEEIGKVESTYRSVSSSQPWLLEKGKP